MKLTFVSCLISACLCVLTASAKDSLTPYTKADEVPKSFSIKVATAMEPANSTKYKAAALVENKFLNSFWIKLFSPFILVKNCMN